MVVVDEERKGVHLPKPSGEGVGHEGGKVGVYWKEVEG